MLRSKRLLCSSPVKFYARNCIKEESKLFPVLPLQNTSQWSSCRSLDIYQIGSKEAIEKERARLKDEMNRGYFADMPEMKPISFIDSWLLSRNAIKKLLLKIMRKPKPGGTKDLLQRQIVYSFGDHYYFRKELRILNLLTGYIFLIDKMGRIRWQGFGSAKQEELLSLLSCTSLLLDEK
ncbi:uncharacterized protein LOC142528549 [Primulina tabacum]|uniref:uncharacterized protein LOC142528549 n=1 Tax=Primulina tabacum TaxID=48773 RepID=UPI003F59BF0E